MLPFLVTNRATKKEIQLIQNKCLKIILNLPTRTSTDLIHNTLKIEKIHIRIANMVSNYLTSASIYNETIEEFINVHRSKNIPVKKSKRSILDRMYIETLKQIKPFPINIIWSGPFCKSRATKVNILDQSL